MFAYLGKVGIVEYTSPVNWWVSVLLAQARRWSVEYVPPHHLFLDSAPNIG